MRKAVLALSLGTILSAAVPAGAEISIAHEWNEELLDAIRRDLARPTVHARNLFHISAATWDAWAAYDPIADTYLHHERWALAPPGRAAARHEAISYAVYRLMRNRFATGPGTIQTYAAIDAKLLSLGYDKDFTSTVGNSPAALGNRIAAHYIAYGLADGSNQAGGYANQYYLPVNAPCIVGLPGCDMNDPNRWQPLALDYFCDQGGFCYPAGVILPALTPEWGNVRPYAMTSADLTTYQRDGHDWLTYHDPGPPPYLDGVGDEAYKRGYVGVVASSSTLTPDDGEMVDIGPGAQGNNTLGTNDGHGWDLNPATGEPYAPNIVPRGDYTRVLAEFWADGPTSETPPGHWYTIANDVSQHPQFERKLFGYEPVDALEWDVSLYLALGGALHDVAISAWGVKGYYDYVRPISAIRYMAVLGQSSDPGQPSYHPSGILLAPGLIEVVTEESSAPGERHEHLVGPLGENLGKIAVFAWNGYVENPGTEYAGVDWILAENWVPYQRPTFVTPPFPGYVSGHSTYSRAAAMVMSQMTGSEFFPGGLAEYFAPQNQYLVFEEGPSVDVHLQWATYADAADECSLSRIYGGIHPNQDDIPGRLMGFVIGPRAVSYSLRYYVGRSGLIFADTFEIGDTQLWDNTAP